MKIAICISGQLRTWKKCYKTWNFLNVDEIKKRKLSYFQRVGYEAHNIIESTKHNFLFYSNYPNPKKYNILDIKCGCEKSSDIKIPLSAKSVEGIIPMIYGINNSIATRLNRSSGQAPCLIHNKLSKLDFLSTTLELNEILACYNECVINSNIEIDYFAHIWDFNTTSATDKNKGSSIEQVSDSELEEFKTIINPKKILIEDKDVSYDRIEWSKSDTHDPSKCKLLGWGKSQFYSWAKAAELKREYEKENNFEYDVCMRFRPDLLFDDKNIKSLLNTFLIPKDNFMHGVHCGYSDKFPYAYVGDIFYYANSKTFDIISDFYNGLDSIDTKLFETKHKDDIGRDYYKHSDSSIENVFAHYLMKNNIKVFALHGGPFPTASGTVKKNPEFKGFESEK